MSGAVATAPKVTVSVTGGTFGFAGVPAYIKRMSVYAGVTIGSAVIRYPGSYALDATPSMGNTASIRVGGATVFNGVVSNAVFDIDSGRDEVELVLSCDKYLIGTKIIGRPGIGTLGTPAGSLGFQDVGFGVVFNTDGKPNKSATSLDFCTGSSAVYWTLADVMEFIFFFYVSSAYATLAMGQLDSSYDVIPSDLNLFGMTALQAIDQVAQLAGQSWGLKYGAPSSFVAVKSGGTGTSGASLFAPKGGASADSVGQSHAGSARIGYSILNCRDRIYAMSAPCVKETTYSSAGSHPLLVLDASFEDKVYAARFTVDVGQYYANNMGNNLSSGSKPKPWLTSLVTRLNADKDAYLTATEIAADSALRSAEQVADPFLWLSMDGTEGDARLVTSGFSIDTSEGTIEFESQVALRKTGTEDGSDTVEPDWGTAHIWLTVATVLIDYVITAQSSADTYLPTPAYSVILKSDLTPEQRQNVWLPDLSDSDNNAVAKLLTSGSGETYVSVTSYLQEIADSARESAPNIEHDVTITLPFMPVCSIGSTLNLGGRYSGLSGNEVVIECTYAGQEEYSTTVRATDVTAGIDPDRFVRRS